MYLQRGSGQVRQGQVRSGQATGILYNEGEGCALSFLADERLGPNKQVVNAVPEGLRLGSLGLSF
jgi:hypothetical protein